MSSSTTTFKVLSALRLFERQEGRLHVTDVMRELGVSSATAYRYLASLEDAALVSRLGVGEFVLGPEIAVLERAARQFDPFVAAARPVMAALGSEIGASILLARPSGQRLAFLFDVPGPYGPQGLSEARGAVGTLTPPTRPENSPGVDDSGLEEHCGLSLVASGDSCSRKRPSARVQEVHCTMNGADLSARAWTASVRLASQLTGYLVALFRVDSPGYDATRTADLLWRAALRIEGRLGSHRSS